MVCENSRGKWEGKEQKWNMCCKMKTQVLSSGNLCHVDSEQNSRDDEVGKGNLGKIILLTKDPQKIRFLDRGGFAEMCNICLTESDKKFVSNTLHFTVT